MVWSRNSNLTQEPGVVVSNNYKKTVEGEEEGEDANL
jgi:hypothetical protein